MTDKMRHIVFAAALVYGGFAVAGERYDFIGRHHIGAVYKQRCIVAVELIQRFRGQPSRHTGVLLRFVPYRAGAAE